MRVYHSKTPVEVTVKKKKHLVDGLQLKFVSLLKISERKMIIGVAPNSNVKTEIMLMDRLFSMT